MIDLTDGMRTCLQEYFASALSFEELRDIYYSVRSEADKQFEYMADNIAKIRAEDGQYN